MVIAKSCPREDDRLWGRNAATIWKASGAVEPLKDFLREQEVAYLSRALISANGDKERAAQLLGISRGTLYERKKRIGL